MDWFEATAKLSGERCVLQFFAMMRSMASGDAFHRAYTNATQQAFLEGHELGFAYFDGVFRTLRYDNLTIAVKKILRGYRREETSRVIAFRSHWGSPANTVTRPAATKKVGWKARWVVTGGMAGTCAGGERSGLAERTATGRLHRQPRPDHQWKEHDGGPSQSDGAIPSAAAAEERFPIDEVLFPLVVDGHGRVKVKTNWYSTPLWPGLRVTVRVWPSRVEIEHDGECVARHQRCYGRGHQILNLEHYLDVLEKKPGAMAGSTPLEQWRQAGRWPECLDQIWEKLEQRHGRGGGTREMISLVRAGLNDGWDRLIAAVQEALRLGVTDAAAVLHILRMPDAEERRCYQISLSQELAEFERPQPVMDEYDLLLAAPLPGKGSDPVKSQSEPLEQASVRQYCKAVRTPAIAANFVSLAEQAVKRKPHPHSVSGSVTGPGVRRAGSACDCQSHPRRTVAAYEDAGRV